MTGSPAQVHPLVVEAMRKAAVVWVAVAGGRPVGAWPVWYGDVAYLLGGGREQQLPGLEGAGSCVVTVRSTDNGARIVSWPAAVSRVDPGGAEWAEVLPLLLAKRLNLPDPDQAPARWAEESVLHRLAPSGDPTEAGATLPGGRLGAPPPATPAATRTTVPYTVGRRRGRRRQG